MMAKKEKAKQSFELEQLKRVNFLNSFADAPEIMEQIFALCKKKTFKAGQSIISEGKLGDELFIILSGTIEIVKSTLQNEPYTVTTLDASMGGVYVGELALIDNDARSATVIAQTACECLVIARKDFLSFGDAHPEIGLRITRYIARQIAAKLRKANQDVITLFSALVEEIAGE